MPRLSHLLKRVDLGLSLIHAGAGDPEITWAATTELRRLSPYLDGGEVVLTTGLDFREDEAEWRDFVADLSRARVAAIGFGIGVNHDHLPAPLVLAASTYRVALFVVPPPTPFIAVSKAVSQLLRADEMKTTQDAIRTQQQLLSGAHGTHDPAGVLARLADSTGRHLALVRPDGSIYAQTAGYAAATENSEPQMIALDLAGSLRLAVSGSEGLSPEQQAVIAAGAVALGMRTHDLRAAEGQDRAAWGRLTRGLLDGVFPANAMTILDPSLTLPSRVQAVAVQGAPEDVARWRRAHRASWERLVTSASDSPHAPGLALAWQLCPAEDDKLHTALSLITWHGLDSVVGRPAAMRDAALSRNSAASRIASLSRTAPLYEAPRSPQVVHATERSPLLEAFRARRDVTDDSTIRAVLGPLSVSQTFEDGSSVAGLPVAERDVLRVTLRALFEHDGRRGPTAASLGIHRNTLRDRLSRIERLTDRSLVDPDDRVELWLALRLEEMEGKASVQ